jgi:fructose-1-phosphate kinase PfkB-like protein
MVGAMAYFLSKKGSTLKEPNLEEMLRMGLAASASVLSRRYTSVLKRNEVTSFYSKVFTTQID